MENQVELILKERKEVKFLALDAENSDNINNFKVWIQGKVKTQEISGFVFVGDEVDQTWNISFEKNGYLRSEVLSYCPSTGEKTISLKLKKKGQQKSSDIGVIKGKSAKKKTAFYAQLLKSGKKF